MTNGEEILKEMNAFSVNAVQASPEQSSGEEVLPFESLDDYSTDPIGFEELADMVNKKVKYFFSLSAKYNHRAPEYLEVCGFLERGIKYLGSCCLTKVMLKKKGHELPKLDELSTHWLYGMVSFNIRKLNRTVDEELSHSGTIPSKWLDMQFRYINLAERLKSTETKIYEYTSYYWLDSDKFVRRALMFSENAYNRVDVKKYVRKPDFRLAPSFPAAKIENKKSEIRNKKSESGNTSTQYAVPGTLQSAADDNWDCRLENKKSKAGGRHPETVHNGNRSHLSEDTDPEDDTQQHTGIKSGDDVIPDSELRIPHSEEAVSHPDDPVPAFMAILERAAERSKDREDSGICFTFEELDALASDPEFREFDPDLAEVIRKRHAELFPGIGSP